MRGNIGGSIEDNIKTSYDKVLIKRLLKYLKPYILYVIISFVMLLFIAATELAMPAITKIVVDDYITANNSLIEFDDTKSQQQFIAKYKNIKFEIFENHLIFPHKKINVISEMDLNLLKNSGKLHTKMVILENSSEVLNLLPNVIILNKNNIAFSSQKLTELKKNGKLSDVQLRKIQSRNIRKIRFLGFIVLGIVLIQVVFYFLQIYTINFASQHAMYDLRKELFAHISRMPLSFFDKNPVGRLVTRITNDVRTLDEMFSNGLIQLIQEFVVLGGIIVMMLILDWKLALVTFSTLPLMIILFTVFMKRSRKIYREVRKKVAKINAALSEDISGVKIIQLFNQINRKMNQFAEINREYYEKSLSQLRLFAFFRPLINSLRRVALALLLWFGGGQIFDNMITLGVFIAFMSYLDRFFEPINRLSEKFNILQSAMSGVERIFDLFDKKPENFQIQKIENKTLKGEIEFKNVWLAYNDEYVLRDISFKIRAGENVALVGHTGSGKTSIINLIAGLYSFQKGEILVDGTEISEYSLYDLRNNIGIVQQDVFLFSGNIKQNIVLNNAEISAAKLQQIAEYVNVHKFINGLPQKFDEPVMERGSTFSVGQRQLIAFARVLAYNPAIFVLDEATSNIDTETEILIQDALQKLMENRTSIVIAHRLSTIQHVDRIIVLHKGKIVEVGNHQELLQKNGIYHDLYKLQYT
ncbi:MAG: ABC transporter ATP-binding protein [Candidatus Cloacimonetes bacterium]|jgi:ATP-binding cassette, subfamily B, multidrug efflux pump|nr:ABC transporter ATP-binding protein [Candidatus Cloacimonadota bacterium]MBT6994670.1 ABC transporter ATP-binding protein [Candidatus Cloacimonadota bacterium]MBT7469115.1 ABC transporter ATP-binding protein [Candidatus Cloacimonadota bacterium]